VGEKPFVSWIQKLPWSYGALNEIQQCKTRGTAARDAERDADDTVVVLHQQMIHKNI